MHIFLTGAKGVGKSTALQQFCKGQRCPLGGFRTVRTQKGDTVTVFMVPAGTSLLSAGNRVVLTRDSAGFHPRPEVFDTLGCDLLSQPGAELIVMDELGPAESDAALFRRAVLRCLDGPIPIVGVIQQAQSAFLEEVRGHPHVRLLEVTEENRGIIPDEMAALWPQRHVSCVVMASGHSKRFGQDKLLYPVDGAPMLEHVLRALPRDILSEVFVVARTAPALALAAAQGCTPIPNPDTTDDTAMTIRLGIQSLPSQSEGCLFCVADQPWLTQESIRRLLQAFFRNPNAVVALSYHGERGNPVLYPRALFQPLASLKPGQSGRAVLAQNLAPLLPIEAGFAKELHDVDVPAALSEPTSLKPC